MRLQKNIKDSDIYEALISYNNRQFNISRNENIVKNSSINSEKLELLPNDFHIQTPKVKYFIKYYIGLSKQSFFYRKA